MDTLPPNNGAGAETAAGFYRRLYIDQEAIVKNGFRGKLGYNHWFLLNATARWTKDTNPNTEKMRITRDQKRYTWIDTETLISALIVTFPDTESSLKTKRNQLSKLTKELEDNALIEKAYEDGNTLHYLLTPLGDLLCAFHPETTTKENGSTLQAPPDAGHAPSAHLGSTYQAPSEIEEAPSIPHQPFLDASPMPLPSPSYPHAIPFDTPSSPMNSGYSFPKKRDSGFPKSRDSTNRIKEGNETKVRKKNTTLSPRECREREDQRIFQLWERVCKIWKSETIEKPSSLERKALREILTKPEEEWQLIEWYMKLDERGDFWLSKRPQARMDLVLGWNKIVDRAKCHGANTPFHGIFRRSEWVFLRLVAKRHSMVGSMVNHPATIKLWHGWQ